MRIDITLRITAEILESAFRSTDKSLMGHWGTHFDVMDKDFPLEYTERNGIVFDVRMVKDRDIDIPDIDISKVSQGMFVVFYTGYIENERYGTSEYFKEHPQLSLGLIDALLDKKVSVIGLDFAGVRRGKEHTPMDQKCADRGVFIIENLCDLGRVLEKGDCFKASIYPMNCIGMTGLPCRVTVDI